MDPHVLYLYIWSRIHKELKLVCLGSPNSSGYLVWLSQQVSSTFDQIYQGILHIISYYTYIIPHESKRSRELQVCKLVHGG